MAAGGVRPSPCRSCPTPPTPGIASACFRILMSESETHLNKTELLSRLLKMLNLQPYYKPPFSDLFIKFLHNLIGACSFFSREFADLKIHFVNIYPVNKSRKFNIGIKLSVRWELDIVSLFYRSEPNSFRRCLVNLF